MIAPFRKFRVFDHHAPLMSRLSSLLVLCATVTATLSLLSVVTIGLWFQQDRALEDAGQLAETTSYALQAPLAFDDRGAVEEALAMLRGRADVNGAWVYDLQGRLVGSYGAHAGTQQQPLAPGRDGLTLVVREHVRAGSDVIGTLVIRKDLGALYRTLAIEMLVIVIGSGAGLLLALLIARRVARRITAPIADLAQASTAVALGNDYSQRLSGGGEDEIGHAVHAFNHMLAEVQARDSALEESNRLLEQRVRARTSELQVEKERAEAASMAKTRFLANMTHELRTPLNAVIGAAQLLSDTSGERDQAHLVEAIRQSGTNLLGLIENILDISRIESGALQLWEEDFNLFEAVEAAVATAAVGAHAKALELAAILDPALAGWRHGDPTRLRQVLLNLLGNAVKFTSAGEVVLRLRAGDMPDTVHFSITDTGIGIDLQSTRDIFEPFRQGDDTTTRRFGGTGLGLAISRQLVRAMGGELRAHSLPGQGSCFEFDVRLPPSHNLAALPTSLGHHVAYFEAHDASAQALAGLLARSGCEATRVRSVADLRRLMDRPDPGRRPGWLFVAIDDEQAWTLLEAAQGLLQTSRIVAMNHGDCAATRMVRETFHLARILTKPVSRASLVSRIGSLHPRPSPAGSAAGPGDADPRHRLLVVEDDLTNQMIVTTMLDNAGYRVSTADDGREALQMMRDHAFDLVLMDWHMPEMDGLEVTRRVRHGASGAHAQGVPIVALTANAFAEDRAACLAAGMNDFLTKPVLATQLINVVQRWLPAPTSPRQRPKPG